MKIRIVIPQASETWVALKGWTVDTDRDANITDAIATDWVQKGIAEVVDEAADVDQIIADLSEAMEALADVEG